LLIIIFFIENPFCPTFLSEKGQVKSIDKNRYILQLRWIRVSNKQRVPVIFLNLSDAHIAYH